MASKLGDRLRSLMEKKGVTAAQMGTAAGIDAGTVNQILNGDIARPPDERLRGFAKALGASFDTLLALIPSELREAAGAFVEAVGDGGARWRIRVIRAGLSGNGMFYSDAVLREALPLFEGARVLVKGDAEHVQGRGKDFRNLIGGLSNTQFVEGRTTDSGEIQADFELIDPSGETAAKLREAWKRDMSSLFGFSIDALGTSRPGRIGGRPSRIATSIKKVSSVDLIVEPAAGGQLLNLIESKTMESYLTEALCADILKVSSLPQAAQDHILKEYGPPSKVTETELREAIDGHKDMLGKLSESGKVTDLGNTSLIQIGETRAQKTNKMFDAFFDPDNTEVISIREAYVQTTGDRRFTGLLQNCDQALMRESLDSTSWTQVLGDSIARRMLIDYRDVGHFDVWKRLANVVPINDFRTNERTRFGGYGDLPIVAEKGPYMSLASPTDDKATYKVKKRGGLEDLTLEMIANDDVGVVQRIPIRLARAAKRTLSKHVLDILKDNPVIYDGDALFHANHNNLGSTALNSAPLAAGRLAMKRQTEQNSGDRLGIGPSTLWVSDDDEEAAVDLFRRNTENDKTFLQSLTLEIAPVWYWTDPNDWFLSADPNDIPSVEVGFFQGTEEPELFIQDQETVGSMFNNDTVIYKIRHIYGSTVTDFRGLYGAVVA